jgi:hypothetical protein
MALEGLLPPNLFALHGNAFNPDKGQLADYRELSNCREGPIWHKSCANEVGPLAEGHGKKMLTGTQTIWFISHSKVPKHKKPTYFRIVAAYHPRNPILIACVSHVEEIKSSRWATSAPRLLISPPSNVISMMFSPRPNMCMDLSNFYLEIPNKKQYAEPTNTTPFLDLKDTKRVQEVLGTFLYYGRAMNSTMLVAIRNISTQQAKGTQATMQAIPHLLNYCATHPNATICYIASDICLHVDSDASYLSVSKARSRVAGFPYLSSRPRDPNNPLVSTNPPPPSNVTILTPCHIMREALSSTAEAKLGGLFYNGKEACPICITLEELGYPQPTTVIVTDNSTASSVANNSIKQKRSKAINMQFNWTHD